MQLATRGSDKWLNENERLVALVSEIAM